MSNMNTAVGDEALRNTSHRLLKERGVTLDHLVELVYILQSPYYPHINQTDCLHNIERVLEKREVQNAILTGIQLDLLAEEKKLMNPLQKIIETDEGLYGVDEIIALSIVNVYGSIGLTNYGYIDKIKPGILQKLNDKKDKNIHTFLDDIVGAIAAAASSRLAHRHFHTH